jgi:WD40 repeat protein
VGPPSLLATSPRDQAITQLQKAGAPQPLTASLLASEALLHTISIRACLLNALAVLPDGRLASGSRDKTIKLWDPTTANPKSSQPQFIADAAILTLAFLPAPPTLVAGDASGRLHWLRLPGP